MQGKDIREKLNVQKLFDIPLFYWSSWEEIEAGFIQFCVVEFPFESMKKYNLMDASLDMNGEIVITDDDGNEVWRGFAYAIPEFRRELNARCEVN